MLICMRTTLNIDDTLLTDAKILAVRRRTTLTALVERGLREVLAEEPIASPARIELPVWHGAKPRPGIDFSDTSELVALMDEEDAARRR